MASHFLKFQSSISGISLPEKFTFPFYYDPHPLGLMAAEELKEYLKKQHEFDHNFGLDKNQTGLVIGKMFGVLVVQNTDNELGYLAAFSGKLANRNHHDRFVPPVFDMLKEDGFFRIEERNLTQLNNTIEALEGAPDYLQLKEEIQHIEASYTSRISNSKSEIKDNKAARQSERERLVQLFQGSELEMKLEELRKQSIREQYYLKDLHAEYRTEVLKMTDKLVLHEDRINALKEERKNRSAKLQEQLFESYSFLNQKGETRSLRSIFSQTTDGRTPSGAGECAAPKLLQYAFKHQLKPIALAEFWWGTPPPSEVRVHGQFYPACRGKCEPILGHMLQGMDVDPNPMLDNPAANKELSFIYEDEEIILVNKPAEFLSVPGRRISDSVYTRIKQSHPEAEGPLIVHRLDMSTSGLMIIAKTLKAYHHLQRQFIQRTVKKRYVALLDGIVKHKEGVINLPMRVDLDDRPRQVICFEHGKQALTEYEVIERYNDQSCRILFYPKTGRTHQLRVHSAHRDGLGCPIKGDELYGKPSDRLYLHAEWIEITHPRTQERCCFTCKCEF